MNFYNFTKPDESSTMIQFINGLLAKKIFNDQIFEDTQIRVSIKLDSPIQLFYRRLWETLYLKRKEKTSVLDYQYNTAVALSVSECIQYLQGIKAYDEKLGIYEGKEFRDKVSEFSGAQVAAGQSVQIPELNTFDDVFNTIKAVLTATDDPKRPYYLTHFHEVFHFDLWQNNWIPDYEKIAFARTIVDDPILLLVDTSTVPINKIVTEMTDKIYEDVMIQMSFHVDSLEDIVNLYHFINMTDLRLSGVQCNDIGLFVSAYSTRLYPQLARHIRDIYSQFG